MGLLDIFEERMQQIFEHGNAMAPFPFKKLAKTAVREMKSCSAKLDGRVVAPTLYTILVNPQDDAVIGMLYQQVTDELVDFLAHEAQNEGLTLTSNPTVRFIPVEDIKRGKMEVIAEIVSPDVLEQVRAEESDYMRGRQTSSAPLGQMMPRQQQGRPKTVPVQQQGQPMQAMAMPLPQVDEGDAWDEGGEYAGFNGYQQQAAPQARAQQPMQAAPQPRAQQAQAPQAAPQQARRTPGACQLRENSSGKTWRIATDSTVIGRDETQTDLVLEDSNVSRRHAELKRTASGWVICDLGSTNGTRVNGMRVTEQPLNSGDMLTMGLVTLSFEEI
jgi:hypothetical protein